MAEAGTEPQLTTRSQSTRLSAGESQTDQARYGRLYTELRRSALGMVRRAYGTAFGDDELEDLYSAAWLSTLAALERKERELDDEELRRYLLTAVANQASRELRRRGRKPTVPLDVVSSVSDPTVSPEDRAAQGEQSQLTREILASLPPRRRAVMLFRYGWGLQPSEVQALVDGLSSRAYRKEIERGVTELAEKLRLVEDGEWCRDREPLLRALAAGLADADEQRQARQHITRCRSCADHFAKLTGALHDLGGAMAWAGVAELGTPDVPLLERGGVLLERGKQALSSALGRGSDVAQSAADQVSLAGGSRGVGTAGVGVVAKLAGLGAVPKIVATCVGTGAAATACVAAGVGPGIGIPDLPGSAGKRPAVERPADGEANLTSAEELEMLSVVSAHPDPTWEAQPPPGLADQPPADGLPSDDGGSTQSTASVPVAPEQTVAGSEPTVEEFEAVGTSSSVPAAGSSVTRSSSGGGGSAARGGDFGP